MKLFIFALLATTSANAFSATCLYPAAWWKPVPASEAKAWEVLPQDASCEAGDVILSKRTELGIFSNYGATPILFRGVKYASLEGFWQSLKYPEGPQDPRALDTSLTWNYTRAQVAQLTAEEAKKAGDLANANMKKMGIAWVTFENERMEYKAAGQKRHYEIIEAVSRAKVDQNPNVKALLLKTGNLNLRPDHKSETQELPSYRFYDIYMKIRGELKR
ncbi:MAG: hypothetical protein V4736_16440 [Bdellovibrionota bacterium]